MKSMLAWERFLSFVNEVQALDDFARDDVLEEEVDLLQGEANLP